MVDGPKSEEEIAMYISGKSSQAESRKSRIRNFKNYQYTK